MPCYELVGYPDDLNGAETRTEIYAPTDGAAASRAGTKSKRINGPVDVARVWPKETSGCAWNDRYITTASPSQFHAKGYRLERLTS